MTKNRIVLLFVIVLASFNIYAYAPIGTFTAEVDAGNTQKTLWLKFYDDPNSPYIGQFNKTPYRSFTLQGRITCRDVKGIGDCRVDVTMFYVAKGYVSRGTDALSFYIRTTKLDRKVEKIVLNGGCIEDQEKTRDALLNMDNSFYNRHQQCFEGEQRYDFMNFFKNGFSAGMNPFTSKQLVFTVTGSKGIENNLQATKDNVTISSSEHNPLAIPDDSLYNPNKNKVEKWCGKWQGNNSGVDITFELYSDFTMAISMSGNFNNEKAFISSSFTSEGEWKIKDGALIFQYDTSKSKLSIDLDCEGCSITDKQELINKLMETEKRPFDSYKILGHNQCVMSLSNQENSSFYVKRKRATTYTPHLYPDELPDGDVFTQDNSHAKPLKGFVRGVLTKKNGDKIIGLFKKNLDLYPVLADTYSASNNMITPIDIINDELSIEIKEKEKSYKNEIKDALLTPESGCSEYTFSSGVIYNGCWLNHQPHGLGIKRWPNGHFLDGQWKNGQFQGGSGKLFYINTGDVYEGELDMTENPHGKGRMTLNNKGEYVGQFNHGEIVKNQGVMTYLDGTTYDGNWDNLGFWQKDGQGVMICTDGTKISGTWQLDKLIEGSIEFKNGHKYIGTIEDDQFKHGSYSTNEFTFEGDFDKGYFLQGTMTMSNTNSYIGTWSDKELLEQNNIQSYLDDETIDWFKGDHICKESKWNGTLHFVKGYSMTTTFGELRKDSSIMGTLEFDNGDKVIAYWTANNITPESDFIYQWADGLTLLAIVNKKGKLTKMQYQKIDVEKVDKKDIKSHTIQYTGDESFTLPPYDIQKVDTSLKCDILNIMSIKTSNKQ